MMVMMMAMVADERKKKHLPISEDWEVDGLRALRKHHYFYFNQFLERDESKH